MGMEWDWGCPISDEWAGMGSLLRGCIPFLPIVWADGKCSPLHPISGQEFPFHPIFDPPEFIVLAGWFDPKKHKATLHLFKQYCTAWSAVIFRREQAPRRVEPT
jgi:hypothetical protein